MARDLNKVMIIGNLTRDPELRYTPNGQAVAGVGVATNRSWNDSNSGEKREEVEFHDVVLWGKLAEISSQILAKGRRVYFEGRLQTRSWEGQDGAKRQKTEIIASDMIVLDRPPQGMGGSSEAPAAASAPAEAPAKADEKPAKAKAKEPEKEKAAASSDEINIEDIPF